MSVKSYLKQHPALLRPALWFYRVGSPLLTHPLGALRHYPRFLADWLRYRRAGGKANAGDLFPCLFDRTDATGFDSQYFYQAAWAFAKIHAAAPPEHVDVGSDLRFMGMLSGTTHVTFIDIRPADIDLPRFDSRAGSLLEMPYADGSVASLSCLHVIEHIGLGRYGDPIDPEGPAKGFAELERIVAPGGRFYLSTPTGRPRVQFNGQWVFSVQQIIDALPGLQLREMAWVDGHGRYHPEVTPDDPLLGQEGGLDFSLGMFIFEKPRTTPAAAVVNNR